MHNYFTPYRSLLQHQNTLSLFSYYTSLSHSAFRLASCKLPCSSPKLWRYHIHQIVTVHLISHSLHSIAMRWDRDDRDGLPRSDENGNNNCKVLETREISFLMLINPIHMCTHQQRVAFIKQHLGILLSSHLFTCRGYVEWDVNFASLKSRWSPMLVYLQLHHHYHHLAERVLKSLSKLWAFRVFILTKSPPYSWIYIDNRVPMWAFAFISVMFSILFSAGAAPKPINIGCSFNFNDFFSSLFYSQQSQQPARFTHYVFCPACWPSERSSVASLCRCFLLFVVRCATNYR